MNSMRHLAFAAFAAGWLFAGTPAHAACDDASAGACSYPVGSSASAEDKKTDKKTERRSSTRREGRRRSARSGRYRHRSAYRSSRRWTRSSRRSRHQRFANQRGSSRPVETEDETATVTQESVTPAPIVNADDATVQVLPQAMETGTSLSPVPQTHIASALTFRFGPRSSEAAPMQMAQASPGPTISTARVVAGAGQIQQSAEMQTSNVGQAMTASPQQESDGFLLRAMFLTLAGALTLATAVRLVIG